MRSYLPALVSAFFLAVAMAPEAVGETAPEEKHSKGMKAAEAAAATDTTDLPAAIAPSGGFFGSTGSGGGGAFFQNQGPSSVPYIVGAGAVGIAAGKALLDHKGPKTVASTKPHPADHLSPRRPPKPERPPHGQGGPVSPPETTPEDKPSTPADAPEPGTLGLVVSAAALSLFRRRSSR